jgi:hypothetical protein
VGVGLQPAGPAVLLATQGQLVVVGAVGLLAGHQRGGPVGRGRLASSALAKHPLPLALLITAGGEFLQGQPLLLAQ